MKYAFIAHYKKTWPVDLMCRLLGVSRNGYYSYWRRRDNTPPDPKHQEMLDAVKAIGEASDYSYGSRRMKKAMNALGFPMSRSKARRLMKEAGIQVRYRKKYKVTTNSNHNKPVFDNVLDRQFAISQPDQAYVADITYSVPGVQGRKGNRNEPRICLKSIYQMTGVNVLMAVSECAEARV